MFASVNDWAIMLSSHFKLLGLPCALNIVPSTMGLIYCEVSVETISMVDCQCGYSNYL